MLGIRNQGGFRAEGTRDDKKFGVFYTSAGGMNSMTHSVEAKVYCGGLRNGS
jgi:hypothetical protein